jgi:hypothetical protein
VDDKDYQIPFKLTAKLDKLTIKIDLPMLASENQEEAQRGRGQGGRRPVGAEGGPVSPFSMRLAGRSSCRASTPIQETKKVNDPARAEAELRKST